MEGVCLSAPSSTSVWLSRWQEVCSPSLPLVVGLVSFGGQNGLEAVELTPLTHGPFYMLSVLSVRATGAVTPHRKSCTLFLFMRSFSCLCINLFTVLNCRLPVFKVDFDNYLFKH